MTLCLPCEALKGKPGDIDPHDDLRGQHHSLIDDGVEETYHCRCGAKFERFVANKSFGNRSGCWNFLNSAGR
jgi:hypothetical protein